MAQSGKRLKKAVYQSKGAECRMMCPGHKNNRGAIGLTMSLPCMWVTLPRSSPWGLPVRDASRVVSPRAAGSSSQSPKLFSNNGH